MKDSCEICKKEKYKYVCPKCKIVYCSLQCYQDHSLSCREAFHKEQVESHLKGLRPSEDEKKKFEKILWKLHNLDKEDDADNEELKQGEEEEDEERIEMLCQLAEQDTLTVDDLTENEWKRFRSAIKLGELNQYFETYNPWWNTLSSDARQEIVAHICCRKTRTVSWRVVLTTTQTLYGYCYLLRSTMGCWELEVDNAEMCLVTLCMYLFSQSKPEGTISQCLLESLRLLTSPPILSDDKNLHINCLLDVIRILSFKDFALRAFSEVKGMIEKFISLRERKTQPADTTYLTLALRKLEFLISVVHHHWGMVNQPAEEVSKLHGELQFTAEDTQVAHKNHMLESNPNITAITDNIGSISLVDITNQSKAHNKSDRSSHTKALKSKDIITVISSSSTDTAPSTSSS